MSDTFVPPGILAGGSDTSTTNGNVYATPLEQRSPAELSELSDRWFDRATENRRHVENQALQNLAFMLGQQYVKIDPSGTTSRVVPTKKRPGQVRTVDNIVITAVRSELARLLRTRPFGTVIPQGDDSADYEAARAADAAVLHTMREGSWEEAVEEAALWGIIGGTGHIGTSWEANQTDSFGQEGLVTYRALSPFEFAVPHLRRSRLDDQPYVMVTKAFEVDEIEMRWGRRVAADRQEQFSSYDQRLTGIITGSGRERAYGGQHMSKERSVPVAVVKEVWIRPSEMAPNGAVIISASGQLLQFSPQWPEWCNGQYPFAKVDYTRIAGAYWGQSLVSDLVPLQRRHNRAASAIVELQGLLTHMNVTAPRGTKVKSMLRGRGTMLEVPPGVTAPPQQLRVDSAGNLPFVEMDATRAAVRDIAHQSEVTRGTTPPNVRSGTAIAALKDLDDAAATIPIRSIERATQRMGRFSLSLIKEKWTEQRMVLVLGTDGDVEMRSFLDSGSVGGQYWVQPGSAWPATKAQRQAMLEGLYDRQVISAEELLQYLEVGTPQGIRQERKLDERHARRENQRYERLSITDENGQMLPNVEQVLMQAQQALSPAEWHNHQAHLKEHNRLRKTPSYEQWPPWKKQMYEAHISGHRVALEQQLMAQMRGPGGNIEAERQAQAGAQQQRRETAMAASGRMDQLRQQEMAAQEQAIQQALAIEQARRANAQGDGGGE